MRSILSKLREFDGLRYHASESTTGRIIEIFQKTGPMDLSCDIVKINSIAFSIPIIVKTELKILK